MTKYLDPSFTVAPGMSKAYRDNYDNIFGKKEVCQIKYVQGDATSPQGKGIKVITHICNDLGKWGKGFVLSLSKKWPEPESDYKQWHEKRKNNKDFELGNVKFVRVEYNIYVANIIGQHGIGYKNNIPPIRYEAVKNSLAKVREFVQDNGASVHMPRMGSGLAGGEWGKIEEIIKEELSKHGIEVTVYDLKD